MWQDYIEPGDELDPASPMKRSSRTFTDGDNETDFEEAGTLPETTLTSNLGLDIVVVVTKVMITLWFDFLRKCWHFKRLVYKDFKILSVTRYVDSDISESTELIFIKHKLKFVTALHKNVLYFRLIL